MRVYDDAGALVQNTDEVFEEHQRNTEMIAERERENAALREDLRR